MSEETEPGEPLVPLFSPPLAELLAQAEQNKGGALTESEVEEIRDHATYDMVPLRVAIGANQERGFQDVRAENCWADWHRVRSAMVGGPLPRLILCLPGDEAFVQRAAPLLEAEGIDYEVHERSDLVEDVFRGANPSADGSLGEEDFERIRKHTKVLYMVSRNYISDEGPGACRLFMNAAARLLDEGAIAVKSESSGIAHSAQRWKDLAKMCGEEWFTGEFWDALVRAYVQSPIGSVKTNDIYSCGMHLLGCPDMVISMALAEQLPGGGESVGGAAAMLFYLFSLYLLIELGGSGWRSGDTFRLDASWPKLRVTWEPCNAWQADDLYYNPFGYWRFAELVP